MQCDSCAAALDGYCSQHCAEGQVDEDTLGDAKTTAQHDQMVELEEQKMLSDAEAEDLIPLYGQSIKLLAQWAERRFVPNTSVVDLGMGTGAALDAIARKLLPPGVGEARAQSHKRLHLVGVDKCKAAVCLARERLSWAREYERKQSASDNDYKHDLQIDVHEMDVRNVELSGEQL